MSKGTPILIIDDNEDLCHNLCDIFDGRGYRATAVHSGEAGLSALQRRRYGVTLLDIRLPDGQGTDLLPAIHQIAPDMPVIIITAYASVETAIQALNHGAYAYILKPLDVEEALIAVRRALDRLHLMQQERQLTKQLRALNQAALTMTAELEQDRVLQTITDLARDLVGAAYAGLSIPDKDGGFAQIFSTGITEEERAAIGHLPSGEGLLGQLLRQTESICLEDLRQHPRAAGFPQHHPPMTTFLGVPIISRGRVLGSLYLTDKIATHLPKTDTPERAGMEPFTLEDQRLIETLAAQAAVAIENAQLYEAERRRSRALALLNRAGRELTATLDLQQVAERVLDEVTEVVGAERASVWLWEEEQGDALVCRAASHQGPGRSPVNLRLQPDQGVVGWVIQTGKSLIVPRASDDPRFFSGVDRQTGFHTHSLLAVPLWVRGKVIGVVELLNKLEGDFDEDDRALVETLATSAAIAIDNAQLIEALHQHTLELQAHVEELDTFAHTVAHDLQNPLSLLIGYAEVMDEAYTVQGDDQFRKLVYTIIKSGYKMSNIIDELLLLAGVRQMESVELKPLDMSRILSEAQERLAHLIEEHQAEIILSLEESWPVALGYGPWVEEVWVNYLSNAIKYGGSPPRVELGATELPDGKVQFWVRDNGPGLTPREQARLFTPFTRLDQVRAKGHGLGLSIARRIVEKLGGEVGVESQTGQGSLFTFTLRKA